MGCAYKSRFLKYNVLLPKNESQCRIKGVLQHPGPQFWGPAIGGSGNRVIDL